MDIHYANFLLEDMFGIQMSEDRFEEQALVAHNLIGNKNCKLHRFVARPDELGMIELPCNFVQLEAVSTLWKDWEHVTNKDWNGDWDSLWIEHWAEGHQKFRDPLWVPGKYVKYEKVGNKLYFDKIDYGPLYILYKGEVLDDNGLPEVSEEEALAIATFIAYTAKYKEYLKTMNQIIGQQVQQLKQDWIIRRDQAKTAGYISQNEWNEILDIKSSWDRHQHNKSYRMYHN